MVAYYYITSILAYKSLLDQLTNNFVLSLDNIILFAGITSIFLLILSSTIQWHLIDNNNEPI
jgi:hypothetical protein